MNKDSIIDKIKKLLRMKRGGTPDEVATALRLAQELAEKHGIDLNKVNPDEECQERPIGHKDAVHGARVQFECKYAGLIAAQFFHVNVFQAVTDDGYKYCMRFVGTDWDTQIANYVYHFLNRPFSPRKEPPAGALCANRKRFMLGNVIRNLRQIARGPTGHQSKNPAIGKVIPKWDRGNQICAGTWQIKRKNVHTEPLTEPWNIFGP